MEDEVRKLLLLITLVLSFGIEAARAECRIMDFAIKDYDHIAINNRVALAFLSLVTKEQYEQIKQSLSTTGSYAKIFEGSLDYKDFKERLSKELALTTYTFNSETSIDYLSQHLSPAVTQLYDICMKNDSSVLGLRMWLSERRGPYDNLRAMWVGGPETPFGTLKGKVEDGIKAVSAVPKKWTRALPVDILVKKTGSANSAGAFVLNVNNNNASYVIVPDPIITQYDFQAILIAPIATASGGNWSPEPKKSTTCKPPPAGSFWVTGTARINDFKTSNSVRGKAYIVSQDEFAICWTVEVSTGAVETAETVSAGIIVTMRTPKKVTTAASPTVIQSVEMVAQPNTPRRGRRSRTSPRTPR